MHNVIRVHVSADQPIADEDRAALRRDIVNGGWAAIEVTFDPSTIAPALYETAKGVAWYALDTTARHFALLQHVRKSDTTPVVEAVVSLDRDTAREVGTFLIHGAGNPSLWGEDKWTDRAGRELKVWFEDGQTSLMLDGEGGSANAIEVDCAQDMAHRLIAWAGPAGV